MAPRADGEAAGGIATAFAAARGDIDLSCIGDLGEELQKAKDEKLLALLNEMAKGGSGPDDGDLGGGGGTVGGQGIVPPRLPAHVLEDDPGVRAGLEECGELWREVQAEAEVKRELHARLLGELRQIQERSERQYQESSSLMQRLMGAKQVLAEKLKEASGANQDLRGRISNEWHGNERLRGQISDGVKGMFARGAELSRQIGAVGEAQSCLVEELQAATEAQAHLQSELQRERVATWRQSTDVVMAFARGSIPGAAAPAEAVQASSTPKSRLRMAAAESPCAPALDGAVPSASSGSRPKGSPDKKHEDLQQQLVTERSLWLRAQAAGSEEQSQLERQCWRRAQRIAELSKELALEEATREDLDAQLQGALRWVEASGLRPLAPAPKAVAPARPQDLSADSGREDVMTSNCDGLEHLYVDSVRTQRVEVPPTEPLALEAACADSEEGEGTDELDVDIATRLREVEQLRRDLAQRDSQCRRLAAEECQASSRLEADRAELDALRKRLRESSAGEENRLRQRNALVARLQDEIQAEQAVLEHEEHAAESSSQWYHAQVEEMRAELAGLRDANDRLASELYARGGSCFRRRRPADASPRGAEAQSRARACSDSAALAQYGGQEVGRRRAPACAAPAPGRLPPGKRARTPDLDMENPY